MTAKHWKLFALFVVLMIAGVLLVVGTSPNRTPVDGVESVTIEH